MTQNGLVDYIKRGTHDDHREGVILAKIAQGDLIPAPFTGIQFTAGSGASAAYAGFSTSNPEPSGAPVTLSLPASSQSYAGFKGQVWGRVIGLRMFRHYVFALPDLTIVVDGEPRPFKLFNTRLDTVPNSYGTQFDGQALAVIVDDLLDDGPHTVQVHAVGDGSTSVSAAILFGWLVERSKGYTDITPRNDLTSETVPTTAAVVSKSTASTRALWFTNNNASTARVVSVVIGSTTVLTASLAAGASTKFDMGGAPFRLQNVKVKVDAGTDTQVTYVPEGYAQ